MRRNLVQEHFAELCDYGGIAATRAEIYEHTLACARSKGAPDSSAHRCADRACCSYSQINSPAETATGLTMAEAEKKGLL